MQFMCFTGMRLADVDFAKSKNFTVVQADKECTRRVVAVLANTKNDMSGEGPVAGPTFVLPCICIAGLECKEKRVRKMHEERSILSMSYKLPIRYSYKIPSIVSDHLC